LEWPSRVLENMENDYMKRGYLAAARLCKDLIDVLKPREEAAGEC